MKTYLIEPCCVRRHLLALRDDIARGGEAGIEGYGDLSLAELLPALLTRYSETEMVIAAPSLPDQAADAIFTWMQRQWSRADGKGKLNVIRRLTIVADLSARKSPTARRWLKANPFEGRLVLVDRKQDDTVILLPDFAIEGPVNMRYGEHFTARATTKADELVRLWGRYVSLTEPAVKEEEKEKAVVTPATDDTETPAEEVADAPAAEETEEGWKTVEAAVSREEEDTGEPALQA